MPRMSEGPATAEDGRFEALFRDYLEKKIWMAENFREFEEDPRTWNEYLSGSVYQLLAQSPQPKEANIRNAIARIELLPDVLAAAREALDRPPLPVLETGIRQNRGVIAFYEKDLHELAGDSAQRSALKSAAERLLVELRKYQEYLEVDLRKRASADWRLGREKFNRKLQFELGAESVADEVLAEAESEIARVTNDMHVVARQLWSRYFPGEPHPVDDTDGRHEAMTIYAISPPPADWHAEQVESFLQEYNRHMLRILTIHEAYPGHYVQLAYSNREPSLVRRIIKSGVFIEGWAVYTEQMMLDQGYGQGDLGLRLTQLKFYLRAVANAILDHCMHCTDMSDEDALQFLMNRAFQSEGEARLKIIRAKQTSVQLSTYFVGRMALYRLRQQVQRQMGDEFDLGRYHESVLDHGSVPVRFLPELVRARLSGPR